MLQTSGADVDIQPPHGARGLRRSATTRARGADSDTVEPTDSTTSSLYNS